MKDFARTAIRLRRNQQRIFDVPGGSVEIARTSSGDYWLHLSVDTPDRWPDAPGTITDSRIDRTDGSRPQDIPEHATIAHLAIRISTKHDDRTR